MLLDVHSSEATDEIRGIVYAFAAVRVHRLVPAGGDIEKQQGSKQTSEIKVDATERLQSFKSIRRFL